MTLLRQKREWDELGAIDPLWAVLSDNQKRLGGWDLEEFFRTGREEIASVLNAARELGRPAERGSALDFGCGVGRLSRALRVEFAKCIGVDISAEMVSRARALNLDCEFAVTDGARLGMIADNAVDFVYSNIVLQHQPSAAGVFAIVREFLRITKPSGIVIFQLPHHIPLRLRLQPRRRMYRTLRAMGLPADLLYRRFKLNPITMLAIPEAEVISGIERMGGKMLKIVSDKYAGARIESRTYFVSP